MPSKFNSMEFTHNGDEFAVEGSFGPSADEETDTPYEAFSKGEDEGAVHGDDLDEDDGVVVDLTSKKDKKVEDEADDEEEIEVVPTSKKADDADEEDDGDISAEEMATYSDKVKARIRTQTRRQRTAERRAARAQEEAEEALRVVALQQQQLMRMKAMIASGETQYVSAAKAASEAALASAQGRLRQALADGDADAIVKAQTELATASAQAGQAAQYRAVAPEIDRETQMLAAQAQRLIEARQVQPNEPPPATKRWMERNTWFQKDQSMTAYAIQFAKGLEADGYDPRADPKDYFGTIDAEMRRRFPEKFSDSDDRRAPARKQVTSRPVASGRAVGPVVQKGKIRLTESQVALANKLGIPLAEYAKEYAKAYPKG